MDTYEMESLLNAIYLYFEGHQENPDSDYWMEMIEEVLA